MSIGDSKIKAILSSVEYNCTEIIEMRLNETKGLHLAANVPRVCILVSISPVFPCRQHLRSALVPATTHGHGVFLLCPTSDMWEVGKASLKPASLGGWHYADTRKPFPLWPCLQWLYLVNANDETCLFPRPSAPCCPQLNNADYNPDTQM